MAKDKVKRRLAAIFAADMVGYSRLMEADEEGTIARQKAHRKELIDPKIAEHNGRIVKTTGDGLLAEFASVVDAVQCAVEVQQAMAEREAGVAEERRIVYRIGVNLGDIVIDSGDIFGDGVNVAARLEALAKPGEVLISGTAFDQLKKKLDYGYRFGGERKVKNIAEPVRIYGVLPDAEAGTVLGQQRWSPKTRRWAAGATAAVLLLVAAGLAWWRPWVAWVEPATLVKTAVPLSNKPSIAVLPFTNMSGDKAQDYFADGMTEDLITDLAKISGLRVIARGSSAAFKGKIMDVRAVAKALGVRYLVKGSVRKAGNKIRINAQLIDANSGTHIWAERYDRKHSDIFGLQDEVLARIVAALSVKLSVTERRRVSSRGTKSVAAYDLYLKGLHQAGLFTRSANVEALKLYKQAVAIDPGYAMVYARMANVHEVDARSGWVKDTKQAMAEAVRLAEKAVALDEENPFAHWTMGRVLKAKDEATAKRAIGSLKRAIELQSNYADAHAFLTILYTGIGRIEEAQRSIETAMRLNPRYPYWYIHAQGVVRYMRTDYKGAIADFERAIKRNPTVHFLHFWLAAAYAQAGRIEDAKWQVEEMQGMGIKSTIARISKTSHMHHAPFRKRYLEGLRKAGVPE